MIDNLLKKILVKNAPNSAKASATTHDEDFTPYVCHYDPNTILTKNGELMQIIRITGFSNTSVLSELVSLREAVREAVTTNVKSNKVAFWFNTIRRKKNISPKGEFDEFFSQKFDAAWTTENQWNDQYVNELYVTIIVEGLDTSIENVSAFMRSFSYLATKSLHRNFLQKSHQKLTEISSNIISEIADYGAKLLGIAEWEGVLYSEPMRFFGKIVNLYEDRYPLAANDISIDLSSHKVAFGDRELEVIGDNNKNFAAMLSVKEYFEVSTNSLDRILQLPCEFIITQSFDFTFNKKELEPYEYQNYLLQVSGDDHFRHMIGISDFVEGDSNSTTAYGKLQTTVMLIAHSRDTLEHDVKAALEQFNALGFVVVREDIFLEHCFWSQLPANFRYLRRQKIINTNSIAGFAALHNFPTGLIGGNHWGPAVTALKTVLNTPYFFNFHDGDLGHSVILGSNHTSLLNFLVTQARRNSQKLFYFDCNNAAKCLIYALGGSYYDIAVSDNANAEFLHLNPLSLAKNNANQNFLNQFFASFILANGKISDNETKAISQVVDRILVSNTNDFATASEAFNTTDTKPLYEQLKNWNNTKTKNIFATSSEINWQNDVMGFDLSSTFNQPQILAPILLYLLHQIENALDESPAILVFNQAWTMFDNLVFAPQMTEFLQRLQQKNCIAIFTTDNLEQAASSEFSKIIQQNSATQIFMPSPQPHKCLQDIFGLSADEMKIIKMMSDDENDFFFKRADDAVIASLDLSNLVEYAKIFNADELTLTAMEEVLAAHAGEENLTPDIWLPQLFEVLIELEKEVVAAEKQRAREESAERRRIYKEKMGSPEF